MIGMNEKCRPTTDQNNGIAERRKEQPVHGTTENVCNAKDLILGQKRPNRTLQTMRLQHLRLCAAANIPEPVNDGLQ